jgi:hypothetical protein
VFGTMRLSQLDLVRRRGGPASCFDICMYIFLGGGGVGRLCRGACCVCRGVGKSVRRQYSSMAESKYMSTRKEAT